MRKTNPINTASTRRNPTTTSMLRSVIDYKLPYQSPLAGATSSDGSPADLLRRTACHRGRGHKACEMCHEGALVKRAEVCHAAGQERMQGGRRPVGRVLCRTASDLDRRNRHAV